MRFFFARSVGNGFFFGGKPMGRKIVFCVPNAGRPFPFLREEKKRRNPLERRFLV